MTTVLEIFGAIVYSGVVFFVGVKIGYTAAIEAMKTSLFGTK